MQALQPEPLVFSNAVVEAGEAARALRSQAGARQQMDLAMCGDGILKQFTGFRD